MRDECRGELLARDRSGRLPRDQSLALRAHLDGCASCRLSRDVLADFDDDGALELDDGARIERLAAAARASIERRRVRPRARGLARSRWRARSLAFAASLVLACGTASATMWWWRHAPAPAGATALRPAAASAVVRERAGARTPGGALAGGDADGDAAPGAAPVPAAAVAPARSAARRGRQQARAAETSGAAALLREASDARRAGDLARAAVLYRKLQSEFAGSPEAVLSSVPLGGLLLDAGTAAAALAQFDAYLVAGRGGALVPEALYGRGRALARLGGREDERLTWQRLLAEFPDSAYATHGRRRLAELR